MTKLQSLHSPNQNSTTISQCQSRMIVSLNVFEIQLVIISGTNQFLLLLIINHIRFQCWFQLHVIQEPPNVWPMTRLIHFSVDDCVICNFLCVTWRQQQALTLSTDFFLFFFFTLKIVRQSPFGALQWERPHPIFVSSIFRRQLNLRTRHC